MVKELHNIMPIANISTVLEYGILSHEKCSKLSHLDISMSEIQERRDKKKVPGGLKLHKYANLYFDARNPMMYKRKDNAGNLCVLKISSEILYNENIVISDQNAASEYVRFLSVDRMDELDFDEIYADDWTHPGNQIAEWRHKSRKCAEVLVPDYVDISYILGAYVVNRESQKLLKSKGFNLGIEVNPHIFFK